MARLSAREAADKWGRRLKASGQDMADGVNRVTEAPGMAAAKQESLMLQKTTEAIQSGKWARRVAQVPLQEWKDKMISKGVPRLSQGVDASLDQQVQMYETLLADVDASVAVVNQVPRGDLETNIGRMTTFAREMHKRAAAR